MFPRIPKFVDAIVRRGCHCHGDAKGARLLGPNCPGLLTPGEAKVGFIPGDVAMPGPVGVVSKSGTLTYEVIDALKGISKTLAE